MESNNKTENRSYSDIIYVNCDFCEYRNTENELLRKINHELDDKITMLKDMLCTEKKLRTTGASYAEITKCENSNDEKFRMPTIKIKSNTEAKRIYEMSVIYFLGCSIQEKEYFLVVFYILLTKELQEILATGLTTVSYANE
ncbi:hypothetical protein HHI36_013390 [Cryptolaemus montrouzieri]|uniref:Uncharacterized protein n=1 Tax=Cryptolaemus montrouzieri TaxID=559131 RepID=A0ABD2NI52_9CUCU